MRENESKKDQLEQDVEKLRQRVEQLEWADEACRKSEERFRKIFDHSNDAIFVIDPERDEIIDANPMGCSMLGYSRQELLSKPISAIHPEEMPRLLEFGQSVFEKGRGWTNELTCLTKSGKTLPAEISGSVIEIAGRTCLLALVRDITERKRTEAALQRAHDELELRVKERTSEHVRMNAELEEKIAERVLAEEEIRSLARFPSENPNPVLRVSKDGRVIYANVGSAPLLKTWGCQKGESLPDNWRSFISEVFSSPQCKEIEIVCDHKIFLVLFAPIVEEGYVTLYGRDITDRKRAEDALRKALSEVEQLKNRLHAENIYLQEEIKTEHNFDEIIGQSPKLKKVLRKAEQVAPTDATVLIMGETGTGKELLARAIHNLSPRKDRPLVKVNCGGLPSGLVESELFGHEKGAFTGALQRRVGRFELADRGTIFLDEVGELPMDIQVRLLRVLQENEFERVGSSHAIKVDVRVIAATNRNLAELVKTGIVRSDLYYRLNVFPLELPPLRERKSDIAHVVNFYISKYSKEFAKRIDKISSETMDRLLKYSWPGNVRELQNVIERALVVSQGPTLRIDESIDLQLEVGVPISGTGTLEDMERAYILRVLEDTNWVIDGKKGAAVILGLHPNTLRSRMKNLGIKKPQRSS
jgi:PAS domain S-box-containing protein